MKKYFFALICIVQLSCLYATDIESGAAGDAGGMTDDVEVAQLSSEEVVNLPLEAQGDVQAAALEQGEGVHVPEQRDVEPIADYRHRGEQERRSAVHSVVRWSLLPFACLATPACMIITAPYTIYLSQRYYRGRHSPFHEPMDILLIIPVMFYPLAMWSQL